MGKSIGLLLLVQVILIALNAVFACAEIAVLSISEAKLEHLAEDGNRRAKRLFRLSKEPAKFLATIQVAITLSGFLGSAFAADNFSEPLVDWLIGLGVALPRGTLDTAAVIVITLVLSYFTLIFGELVPKRLAMKHSEKIALGISGIVSFISMVFKPIVWFLSVSTNGILRLCGIDPHETEDDISEEEIRIMVDAGGEKGTIDPQEQEFIQNVFEFNDINAGDIAIHRTEVVGLLLEDDDTAWAEVIHQSRHTLYPVCDGSPDSIVGILNAKDYFRLQDKSRENVMANAVQPPYFVPETVKADVLFRSMKENHCSLAVVMDEYGGTVGIVTIHDLLEELVGDLQDTQDGMAEDSPVMKEIAENIWHLTGNVPLSDIEDATGLELENEDYDTFTGLVFNALGRIPEDGPQDINLTLAHMEIHVSFVEDHQIEDATLTIVHTEESDEEQEKG